MKRQLLKLSLAICVALLASCAKSTLVPFTPSRSDVYDYKNTDKTIYVFLKTGDIYEMRDFTVTADSIVGTRVLRSDGWNIVDRRNSGIARDDVATIGVIEYKSHAGLFILVIGLCSGLALAAAALAGASSGLGGE